MKVIAWKQKTMKVQISKLFENFKNIQNFASRRAKFHSLKMASETRTQQHNFSPFESLSQQQFLDKN